MIIRRVAAFLGAIAVLTGVVGLVAPVSVDPGLSIVGCGSVINPDLSVARARDSGHGPSNAEPQYTELCRMDLEDRRLWTLTLIAAGGLALAGSVAQYLRKRHQSAQDLS